MLVSWIMYIEAIEGSKKNLKEEPKVDGGNLKEPKEG